MLASGGEMRRAGAGPLLSEDQCPTALPPALGTSGIVSRGGCCVAVLLQVKPVLFPRYRPASESSEESSG